MCKRVSKKYKNLPTKIQGKLRSTTESDNGEKELSKTKIPRLNSYVKKEILIATLNKGLTREEPHQHRKPKKCMMCGKPTTNPSGFCNEYASSMFGCEETWNEEYDSLPTKKELNAKWRIIK